MAASYAVGVYAPTSAIWPPLVGAIILAAISLYSWRRRDVPAALPLAAGAALGFFWLLGLVFEAAAVAPAAKIGWFRFQVACLQPAVAISLCFALEYAYPGHWLTRRNLTLLAIPSLLVLLIIVTDRWHLLYRSLQIGPNGTVERSLTILGQILLVYALGLTLLNLTVFLWLFIRSPQHRWPVAVMLLGALAAPATFLLDLARLPASAAVDPTVVGVLLMTTMYTTALFGFHTFDPLPAARQAVVEQMHAAVVVFDAIWRVVSLNPAAETVLGMREAAARGKTWQALAPPGELLPSLPVASTDLAAAGGELPTMTFGSGSEARHYAPALSSLVDSRGLLIGYLLMLREVTEQRRAEAQILEQQRSLAMLREREHLARELHDGIGQVLGFASLKLGAARTLIADGKLAKADDQLAHLESMVIEAHADVREQILNLRIAPTGEKSFFAALQHYLDGFRQNYGIRVECSVGAGVDEDTFAPEAQLQLFRILQEAFSNARKHGEADTVQVFFEREKDQVHLRIHDNGKGFDPQQEERSGMAQTPNGHFGLRFMRERADELGGSLRVESVPGEGTTVEVRVPAREDAEAQRRGDTEIRDAGIDCG